MIWTHSISETRRWLKVAFVSNFSNESNKYAIYSLNLTNGTTHPLLQTTLTAVPVFSGAKLDSDALLVDFSEGKLWLLQAENDKSISLSDNFGGNAACRRMEAGGVQRDGHEWRQEGRFAGLV